MSADMMRSFDPIRANAYSDDVRFDLSPSKSVSRSSTIDLEPTEEVRDNPELSLDRFPSKDWELDLRPLISTKKWLLNYGLKRNRLDMFHILPQIGFKHSDNYDTAIKKPISSRYASGMFQKYLRSDGKTFNVSCSKDKLRQLEQRLSQAISLYKRRLDWLTSESRRIFGVIEEKSICIVLDIKNMSPQQFDQYRSALERVIKEQVSRLAKFNIIRATEDVNAYVNECVPVTSDSINGAVKWLWELNRTDPVSNTSTCEAVLKALNNPHVDAVYLFTEGSSSDSSRELLKEKLTGARSPVHLVSFNCDKSDTIKFLKNLANISGGRFHAYAVVMEMDSYETSGKDPFASQANILLRKKTYGGVPPGAGMREDVIELFEELEEARNTLGQIQSLITEMPDSRVSIASFPSPAQSVENVKISGDHSDRSETYMSSREWLSKYGLRAKKLGFYDVLAGVAFKHRDGVVELKHAPDDEFQTDAVRQDKLVNARYCDKFPCVRWKDGQVVHVQVTPEMHRTYEQRVNLCMNAIQQRIDWLQQGSRELFGTVIEDQIYILIDTSASMAPHIQFVKDKLFILMQEQLRHKQKFNLIAFDSKAVAWQSRVVDVNEKNLHLAWQWIKGLSCRGSTNTMAALRHALSDPQTQAVYLLTDGRPDQPPKSILAQIQLHPQVPIHTISFNCSDREANQFLCQLAKDSSARFHYYSENGADPEGPEPWESEDIRLLRLELEMGYRNLEKVAVLRDECAALSWRKEEVKKKDMHRPNIPPRELFRSELERPASAQGGRFGPAPLSLRSPRASVTSHRGRNTMIHRSSKPRRPLTAGSQRSSASVAGSRPGSGAAAHTKTSLLRSLNSSGRFDKEWLLPETKDMLDKQWDRQKQAMMEEEKKLEKRSRRRKKILDPMSLSSKKWLSMNGLSALKLTILDALAPTFIPHEPSYVPILNKHVLSRVFDDILPIAHASGRRKRINLVNPQGVDLKSYISRVEKAEQRYSKRLNAIVWNALSQEDREEFGENPVSFTENRAKLMQALESSGWRIREQDIILLESEIKQAQIYIRQAQDLLDSAKPGNDDAESVTSEQSGGKSEKSKKSKVRTRRVLDLMKGQRIIGRNEEDGFYYPGTVSKCPDIRHAIVEYDEIGKQRLPSRFVIPMSGAISIPHLMVGDYVLARVINQETGFECYVPGVVQMTPKTIQAHTKFFTVVLYTGQSDHFLRGYLVKISKMRYTFLVRYINELSPARDESEEEEEVEDDYNEDEEECSGRRVLTGNQKGRRSQRRRRASSRRSSSPERSRSPSPARTPSPVPSEQPEADDSERVRLEKWQAHLEAMQKEQRRAQKKLQRQARKLEKLRKRMKDGRDDSEQRRLLELILAETKTKEVDRTKQWVVEQNDPTVEIAMDEEKGDILVSSGNKGILISHAEESSWLIKLRMSLSNLHVGEEVLARWSDEGWYYRGTVQQDCEDRSYFIEDAVGNVERIYREDIITESDDADVYIQPKDAVIALHPKYTFSYAPGVIMDIESDMWMNVRFYDGNEARLPREEVYRIIQKKFEYDVAYILKTEDQWVGQAVVARNDESGVYQLGSVRERIGDGRQYVIEQSNGQLFIQKATCIFGAFTKRHPLSIGDRVLAIADSKCLIYLPGWITGTNGEKLVVQFADGSTSSHIDPIQCFWLSEDYYNMATEYYRSCQSAMTGGAAEGTVWTANSERVTKKTTYELIEEKVEKVEIKSDQEERSHGEDSSEEEK